MSNELYKKFVVDLKLAAYSCHVDFKIIEDALKYYVEHLNKDSFIHDREYNKIDVEFLLNELENK
jgi:hypothetical protein